jgi:hypothetical protein
LEQYEDNHIETLNTAIIGCSILSGKIHNSLVLGVKAKYLNLTNSIMIGSTVDSCVAMHALLYCVKDLGLALIHPHHVRADVILPDNKSHVPFLAPIDSDGKTNWKIKLPYNPCSWEEAVRWVSGNRVDQ